MLEQLIFAKKEGERAGSGQADRKSGTREISFTREESNRVVTGLSSTVTVTQLLSAQNEMRKKGHLKFTHLPGWEDSQALY